MAELQPYMAFRPSSILKRLKPGLVTLKFSTFDRNSEIGIPKTTKNRDYFCETMNEHGRSPVDRRRLSKSQTETETNFEKFTGRTLRTNIGLLHNKRVSELEDQVIRARYNRVLHLSLVATDKI